MITHLHQIRVKYDEVDQMGYVYHANYVKYCHQARTELLRTLGIEDKVLESQKIMLPVIEMNLKYLKPAKYDNLITIKTIAENTPKVKWEFHFNIFNEDEELICTASSTIAFINSDSRKPRKVPDLVKKTLNYHLENLIS